VLVFVVFFARIIVVDKKAFEKKSSVFVLTVIMCTKRAQQNAGEICEVAAPRVLPLFCLFFFALNKRPL